MSDSCCAGTKTLPVPWCQDIYCLNLLLSGGIMCFTCPVFDKEESGYKEKCESLEKEGKWTLVSNEKAEYYGDKIPKGRGYKTCRMLVYKKL